MTMRLFLILAKPTFRRDCFVFAAVVLLNLVYLSGPPLVAQDGTDTPQGSAEATEKPAAKPEKEPASEPKSDEARQSAGQEQPAAAPQPAEKQAAQEKPAAEKSASPEQAPAPKMPAEGTPAEDSKAAAEGTPAEADKPSESPQPATEPVAAPAWVAQGVWTMPPTEGPAAIDFSLVGEYVGDLHEGEPAGEEEDTQATPAKRLGVQIRALGDGEFEARAYPGGLPGQAEFSSEDPLLLLGRRSGSILVLSGGPWAMFAGPEECKIIDETGRTLAQLPRLERQSPTLGAAPPEGAMVLFDGTDTSAFTKASMTEEKLLAEGADINFMLGDFDLHVEFQIPHMPSKRDQQRGNSGLYLQNRYECQILDSFADANVFNGLGSLYRFKTPTINMAFPPLTWQTYDIHFTAARYAADGSKLRNAHVSAWVNGVLVQDNVELPGPTGAGKDESPTLLPTRLQDHGDPVRFRNIWVIDRGLTGGIEFPQMAKPAK